MTIFPQAEPDSVSVSEALSAAEAALKSGDFPRANQLGREVVRNDPQNAAAWLLVAETAPTIEETVAGLSQAAVLQPLGPEIKQKTYQVVQKLLQQNSFLLYQNETDLLYYVLTDNRLSLVVPKDRAVPEPYPALRPIYLQKAYYWLWLAFLGLPFAGLGALVFAPLAAVSAVRLNLTLSSKSNRIHSLVVILLAGFFWLVGLLLAVILVVHIV